MSAVDIRAAAQEAIDLLAERRQGSPARSPGHNARLVLEEALRAAPAPAMEAEPVEGAPERIWAWEGDGQDGWANAYATIAHVAIDQVEYIRADLAHPQDAESLRGEVAELAARNQQLLADHSHIFARAEKAEAERDEAETREKLTADVTVRMIEERDAALARVAEMKADMNTSYNRGYEDCLYCAGHRGAAALTPQPDAGLEALRAEFLRDDGTYSITDMLNTITALRSRPVGEVKVKPLVWEELDADCLRWKAPLFGAILVKRHWKGHWVAVWSTPGYSELFAPGHYATSDEAKAAAEARIRAALTEGEAG